MTHPLPPSRHQLLHDRAEEVLLGGGLLTLVVVFVVGVVRSIQFIVGPVAKLF